MYLTISRRSYLIYETAADLSINWTYCLILRCFLGVRSLQSVDVIQAKLDCRQTLIEKFGLTFFSKLRHESRIV